MRTNNSIKNIIFSFASQIIIAILGFISRKVFLDSLGAEYLGVNGLLTNVISMLALVESGIGIGITYYLFKPLAVKDIPKIIAYVQLYKRAYVLLAGIIFSLSLLLYPFLDLLIKGSSSIQYLSIAYFIFVGQNIIIYLNAHKIALINADQKGYVIVRITMLFKISGMLANILILISTENYLLFLGIEFLITVLQQLISGKIVNKRYSFIKTPNKYSISRDERSDLIKNVKALFFHNLGGYVVFGTDNILISSFVGVITVGIYSNYTMLIGQLQALVNPLLNGIGASVGNMLAIESKDKSYSIFKLTYFINFWIYSICVISLFILLSPFINWWLGDGYLLGSFSSLLIIINFYITGLRSSITLFKTKAGIFVHDKFVPLIEAAINLTLSIVLVHFFGVAGIFLGTMLSTLTTVFWNVPRLTYKHVFKVPLRFYFIRYGLYILMTVIAGYITFTFCSFIDDGTIISLFERGLICVIIPSFIYILVFYKTQEFQYIKTLIKMVLSSFKLKVSKRIHGSGVYKA